MRAIYDVSARKRAVNLTLNEDLVAQARNVTHNLSGIVESLLADFIVQEKQKRATALKTAKETCEMWNRFNKKYGCPSDEYLDF